MTNDFRLIDINSFERCVNYYGKLFIIPSNIIALATDRDGSVFGFYSKPELLLDCWDSSLSKYIGYVEYEGNFEDSLVVYDYVH